MVDYRSLNKSLKESCRAASDKFYSAIIDIEGNQRERLLQIVGSNIDTEFGRKHNFSEIRSINDFRNSVPITTYEDYEEYVTRIADGKEQVLTRDQVLMLEPTSGSTSPSKFIPYTNSLKREFQQGIFPWLYDLLQNRSDVREGSFYWSITPVTHRQEKTSSGIPIGFGDDGAYFTDYQKSIISQLSAVPFDVAQIQDIDKFRSATLSHLLKHRDLSFISVWNPTFLSLLLRPVQNPSEVWPNLSLISAWADGNAANYIGEIRKLFPNVEIQGKGLIATEGFVSFPLIGYEGSVLSVNSHFFEFKDRDTQDVRLAHEVEKGRDYEVILTTSGGLYRYNLEDIVKVVGFKDQCPLLRFTGRNNNVSDLFGEKLNEYHVAAVAKETLQKYAIAPSFFMIAPEKPSEQEGTSYTLFIESQNQLATTDEIADYLDARLQENYHYRYCRKLGQLEKPRIFLINNDQKKTASDVYLGESQAKGKKIGNVKPAALSSQTGWSKKFNGRYL